MPKQEHFKITLKPAGDGCNLACEHCFVAGEPRKTKIMSHDTLNKVHQSASEYADYVSISWHGGEPLLAGIPFFEHALEIQHNLPANFRNIIQSNLTLVDSEWADFLCQNRIPVGTSLDGTPEIHDAVRHYMDGRGSYDEVVDGIEMLRSRGMDVGLIATFTKHMVGRHMEVYDAFKELNLGWQLNPMIKSARGDDVTNRIGVTPDEYADAMVDITDKYLFDDSAPALRTIDDMIRKLILCSRETDMRYNGSCQDGVVAIDNDGFAYPCGRFTETTEARLGNVHDITMEEIFSHHFKDAMRRRYESTIEGCADCDYVSACRTGCSHLAYYYHDDPCAEDPLCRSYKRLYGHIVKRVADLKMEVKQCQQQ